MQTKTSYIAKPTPCPYLPEQVSRMEYMLVPDLTETQYLTFINNGWRRFGPLLFRPVCSACNACQPIRVLTQLFQPNRSQRRVLKQNNDVRLEIGPVRIDEQRLALHYHHHKHHADTKNWTQPDSKDGAEQILSLTQGPIAVQEWSYYIQDQLVAISYIDQLQNGYSGIYFFYDPQWRDRSLGNLICLSLIERAKQQGLPYVYLGYYIKECRSMEYKGRFTPHEILGEDGLWHQ